MNHREAASFYVLVKKKKEGVKAIEVILFVILQANL